MRTNLITYTKTDSITSELFKTLRTNVEFATSRNKNTIMITSPEPGDGKSFVTSNLAVSFAQMGKQVILLDLDLRKSQVHKIFEVKNGSGVSNLLSDNINQSTLILEEGLIKAIKSTQIENLNVITSGTILNNPSELFMNGNLIVLLEYLKERYDYVFVDVPPITIVTDASIISRYVDSAILVTSINKTNNKAVKSAVKLLESSNVNFLGVVANRVKMNSREYKYKKYEYSQNGRISKGRSRRKK